MEPTMLYDRRSKLDDGLVPPHGGELVQAFVPAQERHELLQNFSQLRAIDISASELHDLEMIASGAYSPLSGFMGRETYTSVCEAAALPNGLAWGLPVVLTVERETALALTVGQEVSLRYQGTPVGLLRLEDIYPWDPVAEARSLYGAATAARGAEERYALGGPALLIAARDASYLSRRHRWPLETRNLFARHHWRHVGVIHMNHPWQRVHEYVLRCALEASDALLLHSAIEQGETPHGLPREILAQASRLLLSNYFPNERIIENPMPSRLFAGAGRATVQHAILSQNYGCHTLFLAPGFNGADVAEPILREAFARAARRGLALRPAFLARAFHCEACGGVATEKSCPHEAAQRIQVSETDIRQRLLGGDHLPPLVARPDVARLLAKGMSEKMAAKPGATTGKHLFPHAGEVSREMRQALVGHKAGVLWMTGLSGSGKSTIAHRLERRLLLSGHRAYVLDGDTLRKGLNRDLGFSDEARRENLRRAGEVAKVLMEAGLIVIASFISPFRAERRMLRELFGAGEFYEVYVEASLEECERRDPKGLYKRARAGLIPQFTGISSPYESPENPEIRLDTTIHAVDECVQRLLHALSRHGLLRTVGDEPGYFQAPVARAGVAAHLQ